MVIRKAPTCTDVQMSDVGPEHGTPHRGTPGSRLPACVFAGQERFPCPATSRILGQHSLGFSGFTPTSCRLLTHRQDGCAGISLSPRSRSASTTPAYATPPGDHDHHDRQTARAARDAPRDSTAIRHPAGSRAPAGGARRAPQSTSPCRSLRETPAAIIAGRAPVRNEALRQTGDSWPHPAAAAGHQERARARSRNPAAGPGTSLD